MGCALCRTVDTINTELAAVKSVVEPMKVTVDEVTLIITDMKGEMAKLGEIQRQFGDIAGEVSSIKSVILPLASNTTSMMSTLPGLINPMSLFSFPSPPTPAVEPPPPARPPRGEGESKDEPIPAHPHEPTKGEVPPPPLAAAAEPVAAASE